jgi:hypothetical protein
VVRNAGKSKATYELEQIQNALNEYFMEYGNYPPVYKNVSNNMEYEYEGGRTRDNPAFAAFLISPAYNNPNDPSPPFFADMNRAGGWPASETNKNLFYRYGLVSYLYPRDHGHFDDPHWYDQDTDRDKVAKAKWAHFLKDVRLDSPDVNTGHTVRLQSTIVFTNPVATLEDPWERNYRYESRPPNFSSYRLWSAGPDGVDGNADDINAHSDRGL